MTLELQLDKEQIKLLLKMVDNASSLEEQRSMPRYGWETRDRIIKPSEIYDESKAKEIMDRALGTLDAVCSLFKSLNMGNYSGMLIGRSIAILYFLTRKITAEGAEERRVFNRLFPLRVPPRTLRLNSRFGDISPPDLGSPCIVKSPDGGFGYLSSYKYG